jgi:hypothetical protein
MYYNPDHYLSEIESYRSEVNTYFERDKPLVQYFYEKLEFNSLPEVYLAREKCIKRQRKL